MALPPENEWGSFLRRQFRLSPLAVLLLFVLVVLLLLLSISPRAVDTPMVAKAQIGAFRVALDMFKMDNGSYPSGTNCLSDLVVKPTNASTSWRPYMMTIPLDPWGHPYLYVSPGHHNTNSYDLSSAGPDGIPGTADDIVNW